jgi:CheY-like chemotaxis protein
MNIIVPGDRQAEVPTGHAPAALGRERAGADPGLRILLAEDHPVNQKVATRMLERLGHFVVVASDGRKAIAALEHGEFDAVLMDVQMPELDGFEALRAIRAREAVSGRHMPIIALTAHAMQGDRERCLAAGFDDYLAKPIRQRDLKTVLSARVDDHRVSGAVLRDQLLTICDGDAVFRRELARSYLESAPRCLGEIHTALALGDTDSLIAAAHALKGISRTIGAADLGEICRELESAAAGGDLEEAESVAKRLTEASRKVWISLERLLGSEVHS